MFGDTRVLVTGRFWLGASGARAIGPALTEMIDKSKHEVTIVAYRLTVGHQELNRSLEAALARGCTVQIILDTSGTPNGAEESFINELLLRYSNFSVWDFRDVPNQTNIALHAKMVISDRKIAIVGSANFSRNGLLENHELALLVEGRTVRRLCDAVEMLIKEGSKAGVLVRRQGQ